VHDHHERQVAVPRHGAEQALKRPHAPTPPADAPTPTIPGRVPSDSGASEASACEASLDGEAGASSFIHGCVLWGRSCRGGNGPDVLHDKHAEALFESGHRSWVIGHGSLVMGHWSWVTRGTLNRKTYDQ
jgi:hypothetical protein